LLQCVIGKNLEKLHSGQLQIVIDLTLVCSWQIILLVRLACLEAKLYILNSGKWYRTKTYKCKNDQIVFCVISLHCWWRLTSAFPTETPEPGESMPRLQSPYFWSFQGTTAWYVHQLIRNMKRNSW